LEWGDYTPIWEQEGLGGKIDGIAVNISEKVAIFMEID